MGAFTGFGLLMGYFLVYSIRSENRTQDVFKSLIGLSALGGGAVVTALLRDPTNIRDAIATYSIGALIGAAAYFILVVVLASIYSPSSRAGPSSGWALAANIIARSILGEDFSLAKIDGRSHFKTPAQSGPVVESPGFMRIPPGAPGPPTGFEMTSSESSVSQKTDE